MIAAQLRRVASREEHRVDLIEWMREQLAPQGPLIAVPMTFPGETLWMAAAASGTAIYSDGGGVPGRRVG